MRVNRRWRTSLVLCGLVLFLLVLNLVYHFNGMFELPSYFASSVSTERTGVPLSLHCNNGRLGNQMCTYATLYGISALNHRPFVSFLCNTDRLKSVFVGPSHAPTKNGSTYVKVNPWHIRPYLKPEDANIPANTTYINGYPYPCSFTFFDHVRDGIRKEFQFYNSFNEYAQMILHRANDKHLDNVIFIGVHVRRGDYKRQWLDIFEGVPVNEEYFRQAFQYYRDKYQNVIFVAVSEDRLWCKENLSKQFGVHVPKESPSPAHDLAILANCNHSIMTYGTFGFWGSYLAGGEVLYFDKFLKPNTSFTLGEFLFDKMYPPYFKGIVTVNQSIWLQSTTTDNDKTVTSQR